MGIFQFSRQKTINAYVQEARETAGSYILDVRTPEEYAGGHIPGSLNIPLSEIEGVKARIRDLSAPVYLYCRSGARSRQGAGFLKRMGYQSVTNMGGIIDYEDEEQAGGTRL